jgi:hypothetical protein
MAVAPVACYEPIACEEWVDRLELEPPGSVEWDEVHGAVQEVLDRIGTAVLRQDCSVVSRPGRTDARAWDLFSYRVFSHESYRDVDPVVVGVLFTREGDQERIQGDICGEGLGDVLYEAPGPIRSEVETLSLRREAIAVARDLQSHADVILRAIKDNSRRA